jgi:hypothetical protein
LKKTADIAKSEVSKARTQNPPGAWRSTLRNLHRDAGYFVVGLTFLYALSGLAVNHINDWDPSFIQHKRSLTLDVDLPDEDAEAASVVLRELGNENEPLDVFGENTTLVRYDISLLEQFVEVQPDAGEILVTQKGSQETKVYDLGDPLPADDWKAAREALRRVGIAEAPLAVHRVTIPVRRLTITFENNAITVDDLGTEADIYEEGQRPRFFLHVANWLHLNRGKQAWTWIADGYAILLIFLAVSGSLMVRGRKGLIGRGGIFLLLGISVPILYLIISGGP